MKTIGILGGGQLGRMLAQAGHKLGFKVIVLDPMPDSPAGQIADEQIVGSFKDKEKVLELGDKSDFITFEIESANAEALEEIIKRGVPVNPDPKILKIIKDKFKQKVFLQNNNILVADFALIETKEDAEKHGKIFGYPYIIKARFDAYDGRGNFLVKNPSDIPKALAKLSNSLLYAEKLVPFEKELAVISARDKYSNIVSFPAVETIHQNNICHIVHHPAPVSEEIIRRAEKLAEKVLEVLGGIGVFAVEMFLERGGKLFVNEIAPRVHNSGHHTIEAFDVSQFEQHIRAIMGMKLIQPKAKANSAVVVNILGKRTGKAEPKGVEEAKAIGAKVYIYGKMETKLERKMGHVTALGESLEEAKEKAIRARKKISI